MTSIMRSKVVEVVEEWEPGCIQKEEGNNWPEANIDIDDWKSKIVCYGRTNIEAVELRDLILKAVEECSGN